MPLYWQCECGERFEEKGRENPGDVSGWQDAVAHVQAHKRNKEPERLMGLIDSETGEVLFEGGYRPGAVKKGILPYGPNVKSSDSKKGSPYQGKVVVREIPIDPAVIICFYEAQARWPQDYPNDDPQTISKFITDCVFTLYRTFPDEFSMGKLIESTIRSLYESKEDESLNTEHIPIEDAQLDAKNTESSIQAMSDSIPKKKRGRPKKKKEEDM